MANQLLEPQWAADYMDVDYSTLTEPQRSKLGRMCDGAAGIIRRVSEREFYPTPALVNGADTAPAVPRSYAARGRRRIRVRDLRSATSVVLDGITLTPDYTYDLGTGLEDEPATWITLNTLSAYVAIRPAFTSTLVITGRWGFNPTPPEVVDAACQMVAKAWKKSQANWADQMMAADGAMFAYFNQLPDQVRLAVLGYKPLNLGFA